MKKILIAIAALLAAILLVVMLLGWWYLRSDIIDAPDLPGATQSGSLEHDGLRRSWLAYVPAAKAENPALLLLLHGSRGDGADMQAATFHGFNVLAERQGFIAVYPNGYQRHWNDCRGPANYAANLENIDDVGFLRALVSQMAQEHGIDPARVYAAGFSNGAQMAYRLAFEAPDLVAGIAAIAANIPADGYMDCSEAGRPVATLIMNGTADPVNPYEGGLVEIFGDTSRGEVQSADASARYWTGLAGYTQEGEQRVWPERAPDDGTSVQSTSWSEMGMFPVALVSIRGGGHTFPDPVFSLPRILGPTSHELNGAEVIWSFFANSGAGGSGLTAP